MRSLRIFFLLATSVLAADNKNYYERENSDIIYPIDYFDDIYNQDIKIDRDSKFSFNFEQIRHDQPPQIEMREENVGRYFNTRPQTTTPFPVKSNEEHVQHVYPTLTTTNNYYSEVQWNQQQRSTIPPPPKFAFSRPQNRPQDVHKNSPSTWNIPTAPHNTRAKNLDNVHRMPRIQTHSSPKQWTSAPKTWGTPPAYLPSPQKHIDEVLLSPSNSHIPETIPSNNFPKQAPLIPNRGTHKFNRNDIKRHEENRSVISNHRVDIPQKSVIDRSTTPQSIYNKPPPPVPTLSPWYDNFGK